MAGVYGGMADADIGGSRYPALEEGTYKVQIDKIVYFTTRKKEPVTVAEFTVLESTNPAHPIGVKRSYFQKMNVDPAMGALLQFSAALAGVNPKDTAKVKEASKDLETFLEEAIKDSQPAAGIHVGVHLIPITLKAKPGAPAPVPGAPAPKPFGKHDWFPVAQAA